MAKEAQRGSPSRSREFHSRLSRRARKAGVQMSSGLSADLEAYIELLRLWNRKIALTSLPLEDLSDEALDRLLIEPIVAVKHLDASTALVLDIGSGGGSPAIPMKLAAPGISLRMVESKTRKAAFLREAVRQLKLTATEVEGARFEQLLARPELHEAFDLVTMRAVRSEPATLIGLQAFLKPGGRVCLFKAGAASPQESRVPPPLTLEASYTLVESLRSRLVVLRKLDKSQPAQAVG